MSLSESMGGLSAADVAAVINGNNNGGFGWGGDGAWWLIILFLFAMNGQYVSREYNTGRSGHSIKDRMIANLEAMVDQASSDYERQQILREIEKMRAE